MNRPSVDEMLEDSAAPFRALRDEIRKSMRTCFPGIVVSFDPGTQTAIIQPAITDNVRTAKGTAFQKLPLLQDVPVFCQGGGGYALTMPIQPGDECVVLVADNCIDAWFQSGGVQNPVVSRSHSLSDAFAFVGFKSRPNALKSYNAEKPELNGAPGLWGGGGDSTGNVLNLVYPVGSIYMRTSETNPSTLFGGTWMRYGTGASPYMWERIQPPALEIDTDSGCLQQTRAGNSGEPVYRFTENGELILGIF